MQFKIIAIEMLKNIDLFIIKKMLLNFYLVFVTAQSSLTIFFPFNSVPLAINFFPALHMEFGQNTQPGKDFISQSI